MTVGNAIANLRVFFGFIVGNYSYSAQCLQNNPVNSDASLQPCVAQLILIVIHCKFICLFPYKEWISNVFLP